MNELFPTHYSSTSDLTILAIRGKYTKCLRNGLTVRVSPEGEFTVKDQGITRRRIVNWQKIYDEYEEQEASNNSTIINYDENSGNYTCNIDGNVINVDKYGNYSDENGNVNHVPSWDKYMEVFWMLRTGKVVKDVRTNIIQIISSFEGADFAEGPTHTPYPSD